MPPITFTVSEADAIAFSEQFYRDSPTHQKARTRERWIGPLVFLPVTLLLMLLFGSVVLALPIAAIYLIGVVAWFLITPKLFDARVRRYAKLQMKESSYKKLFGKGIVRFGETGIEDEGPTGHANYAWNAVDRAVLTEDYLFVFLTGPMGYAIKVEEIGPEMARTAYDEIQKRISKCP